MSETAKPFRLRRLDSRLLAMTALGAALNAVQIAEALVKRKALGKKAA